MVRLLVLVRCNFVGDSMYDLVNLEDFFSQWPSGQGPMLVDLFTVPRTSPMCNLVECLLLMPSFFSCFITLSKFLQSSSLSKS